MLELRLGVNVLEFEATTLLGLLNATVDSLTGDFGLLSSSGSVFGLGGLVRHTRESYGLRKYTLPWHIEFYAVFTKWAESEK